MAWRPLDALDTDLNSLLKIFLTNTDSEPIFLMLNPILRSPRRAPTAIGLLPITVNTEHFDGARLLVNWLFNAR